MVIWQVKFAPWDRNHKRFVIAKDEFSFGKTNKDSNVIDWNLARSMSSPCYFYLELIK
jgi:hypothetical protein